MANYFVEMSQLIGVSVELLAIMLVWTLVWKAFALWKSARKKHVAWFIIFVIVNTLGLLEILYLFVFSKMKYHHSVKRKPRKKSNKKAKKKIRKSKKRSKRKRR